MEVVTWRVIGYKGFNKDLTNRYGKKVRSWSKNITLEGEPRMGTIR